MTQTENKQDDLHVYVIERVTNQDTDSRTFCVPWYDHKAEADTWEPSQNLTYIKARGYFRRQYNQIPKLLKRLCLTVRTPDLNFYLEKNGGWRDHYGTRKVHSR